MEQKYYEFSHITASVATTIARELTKEILEIASAELKKKPSEMVVLDVGCGYGFYALEISKHVKTVIGIEPFTEAYQIARNKSKNNLTFWNRSIEDFNTKKKFDLVLLLTTLEHMSDAEASLDIIFSLLKEGGIIYLTTPNKLWPIESHYKLPFLSYLPLSLANRYLQFMNKGNSYEDCSYSITWIRLHRLLRKYPCTYHFLVPNKNSVYLGMGTKSTFYNIIKDTAIYFLHRFPLLWIFSKGFIVLVKKKKS